MTQPTSAEVELAKKVLSQVDPDFLQSAKAAKYDGQFIPTETTGPILVEDDQLNTEWYNPTKEDVVLEVHIGTDPKNAIWRKAFLESSAAKRQEMKSGNRIFIVKAGQTRMIPSEYDLAIQRTHCLHPQCNAKKDACRDLDHPRVVIAGLGPQLVCKTWHKVPSLSANLDQARSQAEAATSALMVASKQKVDAELETENARRLLEEAKAAARDAIEAKARADAEVERMRRERVELEAKLVAVKGK